MILYLAKTLQPTLGVFRRKDLGFVLGMMLIIHGHPDVHVLSEQACLAWRKVLLQSKSNTDLNHTVTLHRNAIL